EPAGRPAANGAGNPPGAILSLLMNVTRTNPHVACGSSFSRLRTSSAVNSSGICVTGFLEGRCAFTANSGVTTAAPMNVARLRKFRRPTNSESWGFDMVISSITFDYEDSIMQIIPVEIENVEIEMGSVLTIDIKKSLYGRIRLETCVHDPISKRWAIHFKLIVVCERRTLASATFFGSLLRRVPKN